MYYGYSGFNVYAFIILVLIVLQWTLTPATDPNNLTNNGGLFIITLFGLVLCNCASGCINPMFYPRYYSRINPWFYSRRRFFY